MWKWSQSSGELTYNDIPQGNGYSGADIGKNNPLMQNAVGLGPIPVGVWRIAGVYNSQRTGPFTLALMPEPGTDTCGRSAFRIHGDSIQHPGKASHGCIILPRAIRERIWTSKDHLLTVVA
jgi:hypothetical protein